FDVTWNMPTNLYESFRDGIPGYTTLGSPEQSYDYISFKLGTFDGQDVIANPDAKMGNKNLRQAMGYALDIDSVGSEFYSGLRYRATSHIVPNFGEFFNEDVEGYPYDPEKAKELLDEAGYVDVDGDGLREDPNGDELVINYAARANSDAAEPIALYFLNAWKEVGLNVQLLDGRLHETNAFYERVEYTGLPIELH